MAGGNRHSVNGRFKIGHFERMRYSVVSFYLWIVRDERSDGMANQLKMANIQSILALHHNGWSNRRIAKELCIHRDTVGRYICLSREQDLPASQADSKPAKAIIGSNDSGNDPGQAKPAKALTGSVSQSSQSLSAEVGEGGSAAGIPLTRSECEPFREIIKAKLGQGLTAQRIHQDLAAEHGFGGKYHSVRRFVKKLGNATPFTG